MENSDKIVQFSKYSKVRSIAGLSVSNVECRSYHEIDYNSPKCKYASSKSL